MQELNIQVFQFLNNLTTHPIIALLSPLLADGPIFFLPIFLVSMWLYYSYKKESVPKSNLLHLFYAAALAHFTSLFIQMFVHLDRPETAISSSGKLLLAHIPDASFPSDHASVGVAFLTGLYFAGYKKVFWSFLPWGVLMLFSRVIVGVHWPFDIIAGTLIGIISGYCIFFQLSKIKLVKSINNRIIQLLSYIKL